MKTSMPSSGVHKRRGRADTCRRILAFAIGIAVYTPAAYGDVAEAAASCIVTHEFEAADAAKTMTCFENVGLERTSFESGVCQWAPGVESAQTTTKFVPRCPVHFAASCDRLVLNPQMVAPVKIFIYDDSAGVLAQAKEQCLAGGANWTVAAKSDGKLDD